ncbi:MAG: EamA family transporter [Actinobacteria bacterium]|nr:EamA family transporter [Actinomycetota bacterium]
MDETSKQSPHEVHAQRGRRYAVVALALLALIWGFAWVAMKTGVKYADPFTFGALRAGLSAVFLLILLPVLRRPVRPPVKGWTILLGLLQTTGFSGFVMWALKNGGAGKTSVLTYTMPFWLLFMAWVLLGERVRGLQWAAVVLGLGGLVLILSPWKLHGVLNSVLSICTGISWAGSAVVAKLIHKRHKADVFSLTAWQMVAGAVPLIVLALATRGGMPQWTPAFVGVLAYNVLLGNGVAWLLWLFVLRVLPAGTTGLASLVNPVLGVTFAWAILGERPGWAEAGGMALILLGIAVLTIREAARSRLRN